MKNEIQDIINELIEKNIIDINSIPNIDLYVDQLTSFIEDNLYSNNDNNLTKSMVNNYCKNQVIPSSIKKKYSKSHVLLLIIIYNTKSIISMSDIQKIFKSFDENEINIYYESIESLVANSNVIFKNQLNDDIDNVLSNIDFNKDEEKIALLATKLAIEANTKKMLAEILISKYL